MNARLFGAVAMVAVLAAARFAPPAQGDTIVLKRKSPTTREPIRIEGRITAQDKDKVVIESYPGTERSVPRSAIARISIGPPPWETLRIERAKIEDAAEAHCALGTWCQAHGLPKEAREEWARALELDPDHAETRRALGHVRDDGGAWRPEREVMLAKGLVRFEGKWMPGEKLAESLRKGGYALAFGVAIEDDVDGEFFKTLEARLRETAHIVWRVTRGQFYVSEFTVADKTSKGDVIAEKGLSGTDDDDQARATGIGYAETMYVPGQYSQYTFLHEMGHARLGLPDEKVPNQCPACVMCGYSEESIGNLRYSEEDNHTGVGANCWERIMAHWDKLVGPENMEFGSIAEGFGTMEYEAAKGQWGPPETTIKLVNN